MRKQISKFDLNKVIHFILPHHEVVKSRIQNGLKVTYSFPKTKKDFDKPYYHIGNAPHKFEKYLNFSSSGQLERQVFEFALSSVADVIPIKSKKVEDETSGKINGNIRVFNNQRIYNFRALPGFTENIFVKNNKLITYLSLNPDDQDYHQEYKKDRVQPSNRIVENCRREVLQAFGFAKNLDQIELIDGSFKDEIKQQSIIANTFFSHSRFRSGPSKTGSSLRVLDILALQAFYGPNLETNKGNTHYKFKTNYKNKNKKKCIWDASGEDTIELSHSIYDDLVDIRDGKTSNIYNRKTLALSYGTHIENIISSGADVMLNGLDNVINAKNSNRFFISDTHVITKINHKNPKQRILQTVQRYTEANGKTYQGWGNKLYYSSHMRYSNPQYFYFDVENPLNFEFNMKGNHLIISCKSNSLTQPGKVFNSRLTITNFKINPEKFYFFIRSKSEQQTKNIKQKYNAAHERAKSNLSNRYYANIPSMKDDYIIESKGKFGKRIADSDKEKAYLTKTPIAKTHSYVPLAISL